jgi:hypothetical protein
MSDRIGSIGELILTRKLKHSEKSCTSATSSTKIPTWKGLGLKPGLRDERLAVTALAVVATGATSRPV